MNYDRVPEILESEAFKCVLCLTYKHYAKQGHFQGEVPGKAECGYLTLKAIVSDIALDGPCSQEGIQTLHDALKKVEVVEPYTADKLIKSALECPGEKHKEGKWTK